MPPRLTTIGQGLARAPADDPLHLGKAVDSPAIDGQHDIAWLEPGRLGGALWLHDVDARGRAGLAINHG